MTYLIHEVQSVTGSFWHKTVDTIFSLLDESADAFRGLGVISYVRLQYFLLALLLPQTSAEQ